MSVFSRRFAALEQSATAPTSKRGTGPVAVAGRDERGRPNRIAVAGSAKLIAPVLIDDARGCRTIAQMGADGQLKWGEPGTLRPRDAYERAPEAELIGQAAALLVAGKARAVFDPDGTVRAIRLGD